MTTYLMYFHLSVSTIKFCLGTFTFEWFSQTYKQRDLCAKLIKNAKIYTLDTMPRRNAIVHDCSCVFFCCCCSESPEFMSHFFVRANFFDWCFGFLLLIFIAFPTLTLFSLYLTLYVHVQSFFLSFSLSSKRHICYLHIHL